MYRRTDDVKVYILLCSHVMMNSMVIHRSSRAFLFVCRLVALHCAHEQQETKDKETKQTQIKNYVGSRTKRLLICANEGKVSKKG